MIRAARRGVNWRIWHVASSEHVDASPVEIRRAWAFRDVLDAQIAIDAIYEVRRLSTPKAAR